MLHKQNQIVVLVVGVLLLSSSSNFTSVTPDAGANGGERFHGFAEWVASNTPAVGSGDEVLSDFLIPDNLQSIDDYYQHPLTHQLVIDFFVGVTYSEEIALPILFHSEREQVPVDLMFSISWVESRFRPYATNDNPTTIDRGLFQLNSASFFQLSLDDFFHPEINTLHASQYLRFCLDRSNGSDATALAIYNAGLTRVRTGSIPQTTQVYISRVLEYRAQLTDRFFAYIDRRVADRRAVAGQNS